MKNINILMGCGLLGLTLAAQVPAPTKAPAAKAPKTLIYLKPDQIDPSRLLPPPPKDGSPAQQKEMADVKALVQSRTPERYAQAVWDAQHEDATAFAEVIGPNFDLHKLPLTEKLLTGILNDQGIAASTAKEFFQRKFPVTAAMPPSYKEWTCDQDDRKPESRPLRSYPSGHATLAYSVGVVLAALMPEKAQAILARANDYAYSRQVCGDHYHSDVDASRALGTSVGVMLLANDAVKAQLDGVRAELRAAHLIGM
jgi:acid phosphatase (class A)